jgi:flagellar export protein FliJ
MGQHPHAMPRDPLATLSKLRSIDVQAAQRSLAEARTALAARQQLAEVAEAALRAEQPAGPLFTYGAFLAHGLALRQAQREAVARAEAALEAEREALALARGAKKVLGILHERRAATQRRHVARREQARLEDALAGG